MESDETSIEALKAELGRLGLTIEDFPGGGLATDSSGMDQLIARLRTLTPGVTWHDVFPELPAHWKPRQAQGWTSPYKPFGPYDYQELPTGPAVHVYWEGLADPNELHRLTVTAKEAGWPVYGAGFLPATIRDWPTTHAIIVLARGSTESALRDFVAWLQTRARLRIAAIPRTGAEDYAL